MFLFVIRSEKQDIMLDARVHRRRGSEKRRCCPRRRRPQTARRSPPGWHTFKHVFCVQKSLPKLFFGIRLFLYVWYHLCCACMHAPWRYLFNGTHRVSNDEIWVKVTSALHAVAPLCLSRRVGVFCALCLLTQYYFCIGARCFLSKR